MPNNPLQPKYPYNLRGKIHAAGYRTLSEFSEAIGIDVSRISRVCSGWELPSASLSRKMAKKLGVTLREFEEIL